MGSCWCSCNSKTTKWMSKSVMTLCGKARLCTRLLRKTMGAHLCFCFPSLGQVSPVAKATWGTANLRNRHFTLIKLTQYKGPTVSHRHSCFSSKEVMWKYVKGMILWIFTHLFFFTYLLYILIVVSIYYANGVYSNICRESKKRCSFIYYL